MSTRICLRIQVPEAPAVPRRSSGRGCCVLWTSSRSKTGLDDPDIDLCLTQYIKQFKQQAPGSSPWQAAHALGSIICWLCSASPTSSCGDRHRKLGETGRAGSRDPLAEPTPRQLFSEQKDWKISLFSFKGMEFFF